MTSEKDHIIAPIDNRRRIHLPMKVVNLLGIKDKVKISMLGGGVLVEPVAIPKGKSCIVCSSTDDLIELQDELFLCHSCGKKILESEEWKKE